MTVESPGPIRAYGMIFDVAGASAQGPRNENQDAFTVTQFPQLGLIAVADGMGGQRAGRVVAETALKAVAGNGPIRSLDAARYAIRAADEAVAHTAGGDPAAMEGMGCALAILSLTQDRSGDVGWVGASVGDVRVISRSPDGVVRLETRDHTPASRGGRRARSRWTRSPTAPAPTACSAPWATAARPTRCGSR